MNKPQKIRWLIAHEPVELFLRTANAFSSKLAELTNNKFEVEISTFSEYVKENNVVSRNPIVEMELGKIEMSQLHISEIGQWHSTDFLALELPFLFRDHDHAARVFEGEIGKGLLADLANKSPATGLAFTYSGGFRCIASEKEITGIDDIKGLTYSTGINPVTVDTVESVGAIAKPFSFRDIRGNAAQEGLSANVVETTIPRYLAQFKGTNKKYITNTKHSLFLTSIIISTKFWESLDQDTREKFNEACTYAAKLERKWSVEDAENFAMDKAEQDNIGVIYSELSESETEKFKELVNPLYTKYADMFYPGLVDGIIKT